jgi:hypothetical protein
MAGDDKVRENRLRRMALRQGLRLRKSHRRDELALDFARFALLDDRTGAVVVGGEEGAFTLGLDDVERYLQRKR